MRRHGRHGFDEIGRKKQSQTSQYCGRPELPALQRPLRKVPPQARVKGDLPERLRFDADVAIMTGEMQSVIKDMIDAVGGEATHGMQSDDDGEAAASREEATSAPF